MQSLERAAIALYALPATPTGSFLCCHGMSCVGAERFGGPGTVGPEPRSLAIWCSVHAVINIYVQESLYDFSSLEQASLGILDHPVARSPVRYDVQTALYYRIRAFQVSRRLCFRPRDAVVCARWRAPDEIWVRQAKTCVVPEHDVRAYVWRALEIDVQRQSLMARISPDARDRPGARAQVPDAHVVSMSGGIVL